MLQPWRQAGCREKPRRYPPEAGGPQGGIASPGIANLALDGLERLLRGSDPPKTKRAQRAQVPRVRYGADCMSTGSSPALLAQAIQPLVEQVLHTRGLELSPAKTPLTPSRTASMSWANRSGRTRGTSSANPPAAWAPMPWEPPAHQAGQPASHGRPSKNAAQPRSPWVGHLSSPWGPQGDLQHRGHRALAYVVVLGHTEPSEAIRPMERAARLADAPRTPGDLRRDARGPTRATVGTHALSCRRRADPTARAEQRDGKPVRPAMGRVRRGTPTREEDTRPQRPTATAVPVDTARWALPRLPPTAHQTHGMAQPSPRLADLRGPRDGRQPGGCVPPFTHMAF
jgi:hypothetical protein